MASTLRGLGERRRATPLPVLIRSIGRRSRFAFAGPIRRGAPLFLAVGRIVAKKAGR